jgi:16S rRNA G966 N2-methylase RsmD
MQKLARLSMDRAVDQYTQQMFTEADASFAGTTSFYLVDPPFTLSSSASAREEKKSSSNNLSTTSLTEVAEYDDNDDNTETMSSSSAKRQKKSSSPSTVQDKQQQLPMFLTSKSKILELLDFQSRSHSSYFNYDLL